MSKLDQQIELEVKNNEVLEVLTKCEKLQTQLYDAIENSCDFTKIVIPKELFIDLLRFLNYVECQTIDRAHQQRQLLQTIQRQIEDKND